jgi:hypothetical protein
MVITHTQDEAQNALQCTPNIIVGPTPATQPTSVSWIDPNYPTPISVAAQALNLQDALGKIAIGYRADLIAVRQNPVTTPLNDLEVELVILDGVVQQLHSSLFQKIWYQIIWWLTQILT